MDPPASHRVSRVRRYSGTGRQSLWLRVRGSNPVPPAFPGRSAARRFVTARRPAPRPRRRRSCRRFALGPRSLATTRGFSFDFSSSGYLDVSVPPVTSSRAMCSRAGDGKRLPPGSPIRRSAGRRVSAPHRGLSQLVTSFVGFLCQGIHRVPLTSSFDVSGLHTHLKCLDAIFNEENKKSSLSRYAALKVRRGRALETGDCAPGGAAKTGGQPEPAGPVVQGVS